MHPSSVFLVVRMWSGPTNSRTGVGKSIDIPDRDLPANSRIVMESKWDVSSVSSTTRTTHLMGSKYAAPKEPLE